MFMLHFESGNESRRYRIASFLRSKIRGFHLPRFSKKATLGLIGVATLVAAPAAALAVHNFSAPDNSVNSDLTSNTTSSTDSSTNSSSSSSSQTSPSVNVQSQTNSGGSTQVMVNGQPVPVPQNGSVHKTYTSPNGQTTVDVSSETTGDSNSSSIVNVQSYSSSTTTVGGSHSSTP